MCLGGGSGPGLTYLSSHCSQHLRLQLCLLFPEHVYSKLLPLLGPLLPQSPVPKALTSLCPPYNRNNSGTWRRGGTGGLNGTLT